MKKFYLLLAFILCGNAAIDSKTINVAVASQNPVKCQSVYDSFQNKFPEDEIIINCCKTDSLIPEQPVGYQTALKGVKNRLHGIPKDIAELADYLIAIENYIEQFPDNTWSDIGLVLVINNHEEEENIYKTRPVYFSEEYMQNLENACDKSKITSEGYPITVGEIIQKAFIGRDIDPHDWQREPEFGGVSRKELLEEALFKAMNFEALKALKNLISVYPDFPKPGIIFEDFTPILCNGDAFKKAIDLFYDYYKKRNIEAVAGLESRGFILGAALAYRLGVPFIPLRKPGKLPGPIFTVQYGKEYGTDSLSISQNALSFEQRVLVIDDLIATGGSARAAIDLITQAGGIPVEFASLLEVKGLNGRQKLGIPSFNLLD